MKTAGHGFCRLGTLRGFFVFFVVNLIGESGPDEYENDIARGRGCCRGRRDSCLKTARLQAGDQGRAADAGFAFGPTTAGFLLGHAT